jgi:hypothetical protein
VVDKSLRGKLRLYALWLHTAPRRRQFRLVLEIGGNNLLHAERKDVPGHGCTQDFPGDRLGASERATAGRI